MKQLPQLLLYSRLFCAFIILLLALLHASEAHICVLSIMYIGLLTDIFDGIIARRHKVSDAIFRTMDTAIDLVFYLSILAFIFQMNPEPLLDNQPQIVALFSILAMMYLLSLIRWRKLPSPHAVLSKLWGIYIVVEFSLLLLEVPGNHLHIALWFGLLAHLDAFLIYALLKNWDHDIPSAYHAWQIRKGRSIKRHKLLNG